MSIKNNIYNIFGGAGRAALFIITIPLMVNYMGVERFGIWSLITSVGNFALLLDVGIASTTMYFVSLIIKETYSARIKEEINKIIPTLFLINTFFSFIIFLLFLFFSESIAHFFLPKNLITTEVLMAIKVVGIYSAMVLTQHFFSGILQAYGSFLLVNGIKFFNIFLINAGLLIFSFMKKDFYILTIYMLVISIITLIIYVFMVSKKINILEIRPKFEQDTTKTILSYSGTTWLGYFGGIIFTQLDKIVIARVSSPEVVGIYAAIIALTSYISSIATVGLQPVIPRLTTLWLDFKDRKIAFIKEYKLANQFNVFIIVSISVLMLLISKIILEEIMKIDIVLFPDAIFGFQLAILIYAFNSLSVPGFYSLMAINKTKHLGLWQILGALFALFLINTLGNTYGLLGAVVGNMGLLITLIFNCITANIIFNKPFVWIQYIFIPTALFLTTFLICIFIENNYFKYLTVILFFILVVFWFFNENKQFRLVRRKRF